MLLLRFRVENHRSLRDEVELSLVPSTHKGATPQGGDWGLSSLRVAGIYGANASGKSTVIHAVGFMRSAIAYSATYWTGKNAGIPYAPFALDADSKTKPSTYSADVVIGGIRYEYGFSTLKGRIITEWLYSFPEGRHRVLYERGPDHPGGYKFGPTFKGGSASVVRATLPTELFLSRAAANQHSFLAPLHKEFVDGFVITRFDDADRKSRLSDISAGLMSGDINFSDIIALLRLADVGISNLEVATEELPEEIRRIVRFIMKDSQGNNPAEEDGGDDTSETSVDLLDDALQRNLEFSHEGANGVLYTLPEKVQSTGTMSWLALAVPAVESLRNGRVLLVDEIDASLHPQLALSLIQMFRDVRTNPSNAQLIFTTHDTYYLSPSSGAPLADDEVWFAEKEAGATEIYSLSDFSTRKNENIARRYLSGRYGAIPTVIPTLISSIVRPQIEEVDE